MVFKKADSFKKLKSSHVYIHIPFCKTICPHCPYNKVSFRQDLYDSYKDSLLNEISDYLALEKIPYIQSLYFGGGSPSMTPELIASVIDRFKDYFVRDIEIGVEVHPQDASLKMLNYLKQTGVNKISLGIETFREDLLRRLGRFYSVDEAINSVKNAQTIGFECIDINLIYGISGQNVTDSQKDVQRCIELGVDHISAYPLMTFIHTTLGKEVNRGEFNHYDDTKRVETQKIISQACLQAGYKRTSVWSFTKDNKLPYTTVTRENYIGFGSGAGSKVNGIFWFNTFSVNEYIKSKGVKPAIMLETTDKFRRFHWLYWQIYNTKIDIKKYHYIFQRDLNTDFGAMLTFFKIIGWLWQEENAWCLTERGSIWGHRLQMLFSLSYIDKVWKECQQDPWPEKIVLY
ncbi:MAG: radical SAM protein [Candidatus Omnitrophica bacterium]|nr:radical SAM protein [Candidatus Omnitrophota bacterium]